MSASPLRFRSVRTRLTAITLLAFGGVVVALASVSVVVSNEALRRSIDADLRRRGKDFAIEVSGRTDGNPPFEGGHEPPPGGDDGPPRREDSPPRRSQNPRPNPDWIAPASITVGQEGRRSDLNSAPYDLAGYATARSGRETFTTAFVQGEPRRVFSVPVFQGGKVTHVVQVAYAMRPALESLNELRNTLLITIVPLGFLLGGLASFFVVNRLLKPLRHLNAEAIRLVNGGFGERLGAQGDDEFASLTHTLNRMVGHLEEGYRLERQANERLLEGIERQRRFTGDASHELKTPLAVVKTYLGALKGSRRTVAEEAEAIGAMERAADRMNGLIGDLLTLARSDSGMIGERTPVLLDDVLRETLTFVPGAETRVRLSLASDVWIEGDSGAITRLFANLVENAVRHSGPDAPIQATLTVEGPEAVVVVADHGTGIASEHLPHLFERFYRADASRASATGGNGLGLAICESIAEAHAGTISVTSEVGKGTRFTVRLPRIESAPFGTAILPLGGGQGGSNSDTASSS